MTRNLTKFLCTLAAVEMLAAGMNVTAHAADSDTKRRTATGAVVGGAVVGVATGSAGWAVAGAVVGGTGGYLYDKNKKKEEKGTKDDTSSKAK